MIAAPLSRLFACMFFLSIAAVAFAEPPVDSKLPWSQRMADSIMIRHPKGVMIEQKNPTDPPKWSYSQAFCVRAVTQVGIEHPGTPKESDTQNKYINYGREYLNTYIQRDGTILVYDMKGYRLDDIAPGQLIVTLYDWWSTQLGNSVEQESYRKAALHLAEQLKTQPRVLTGEGGFWHKQIYPNQMWVDGIFMACPFMARLGKISNDSKYFDECATQILLLAKHAQDPRTGLLYHGWDASKKEKWADPETGLSKCFWGRGVGWYLAGIVDTLDDMPSDHPKRAEIIAVLQQAAAGVAAVQDAEGLWYQVLDQGARAGNYRESSASCMFTYVFAKGARKGYLDPKYADLAKKAHAGIVKTFIDVDPVTGLVTLKQTCQVAGLGANPYRDGSYEYYLSEPRISNDPKGLAPFILASLELERKN